MTKQPIVSAVALVHIENRRVLVALSHGKDAWYLPGGKIKDGESEQQALIREVREELEVELTPDSIMPFGTFSAPAHSYPKGTTVSLSCFTGSFTGEAKPTNEIIELSYFSYQQKDLTSEADRPVFEQLRHLGLID